MLSSVLKIIKKVLIQAWKHQTSNRALAEYYRIEYIEDMVNIKYNPRSSSSTRRRVRHQDRWGNQWYETINIVPTERERFYRREQ